MKKLRLTNVEYIALKMQEHPGRSQRWYRGMVEQYRHGVFNSEHNVSYFNRSGGYRDRLWRDVATKDVVDKMPWGGTKTKARKGCLHLTKAGWNVANRARVKLGLEPRDDIPWCIRVMELPLQPVILERWIKECSEDEVN